MEHRSRKRTFNMPTPQRQKSWLKRGGGAGLVVRGVSKKVSDCGMSTPNISSTRGFASDISSWRVVLMRPFAQAGPLVPQ